MTKGINFAGSGPSAKVCRPVVLTGQTSDVRPSDTDGLQQGKSVAPQAAQIRSATEAVSNMR